MHRPKQRLQDFLSNPRDFVRRRKADCTVSFFRDFSIHFNAVLASNYSRCEDLVSKGFLLASHTPGSCATALAHSSSGSYFCKIGRYQSANEAFAQSLRGAAAEACKFCEADSRRRRALALTAEALSGSKSTLFSDALRDALEARALYSQLLKEYQKYTAALRCGEGAVVIALGQIQDFSEGRPAPLLMAEALDLTSPSPNSAWWGRKVLCPTLPSKRHQTAIHRTAFMNLAVALARSEEAAALARAEELLPEVRRKYQPGKKYQHESALILWLEGQIKAKRVEYESGREATAARERAEALLRRSFRRLLKVGNSLDVAMIIGDLGRLIEPEEILKLLDLPDPDQASQLRKQLSGMDPSLLTGLESLRTAAEAQDESSIHAVLYGIRSRTIYLGAPPPLVPPIEPSTSATFAMATLGSSHL